MPLLAISNNCFEIRGLYVTFLECCFEVVFEALSRSPSMAPVTAKLTVKDLAGKPVLMHADFVIHPSQLSSCVGGL